MKKTIRFATVGTSAVQGAARWLGLALLCVDLGCSDAGNPSLGTGGVAPGLGGANAGGASSTAGSSQGGAQAGSSASGGSTASGGALSGGMTSSTGGAASGGTSAQSGGVAGSGAAGSGGASNAGSSSGGASTGGSPGGGMSSGGSSSAGNSSNGGSSGSGGKAGGSGTGGNGPGGSGAGGSGASGSGAGGSGAGGTGAGGFDPCPAAEPCKILPLGDSITDGFNVAGGWRIELFRKAVTDNKKITFVGSKQNGPNTVAGMPFPRNHEGYSGYTIQQIADMVPEKLAPDPHIVLMHLGTNDMFQGANGAPDRLGKLIDEIVSDLPDSLLVVSTIVPFPGAANTVTTYNSAIPGVVQQRVMAGKHVLLVDQFKGFPSSELADGVHPNEAGYARMAGVWYEAIKGYLR